MASMDNEYWVCADESRGMHYHHRNSLLHVGWPEQLDQLIIMRCAPQMSARARVWTCTYYHILADKSRGIPYLHALRAADEGTRESVDSACRKLTAAWVREAAQKDPEVETCDFFEGLERSAADAVRRGSSRAYRGLLGLHSQIIISYGTLASRKHGMSSLTAGCMHAIGLVAEGYCGA